MIISNFHNYLISSKKTIIIEITKVMNPNKAENNNTGLKLK